MLQTLANTITPVLWGGVLALLLNLPLRAVENQLKDVRPRLRRALALVLVLFGVAATIFLVLWLLLPQLTAAVASISIALPTVYEDLQDWVQTMSAQFGVGGVVNSAVVFSTKQIEAASENAASELMSIGVAAATYTAQQVARFAIALVLALYLLASKENLAHKASLLAKALFGAARGEIILRASRRAGQVFSAFMIGQCVEACVLAALFLLVFCLVGMPYALPIATLIGVTAFVPVFGSIVGGAFGFLLVLSAQPEKSIWFLVIFIVVQQFENSVIYPRVVGGRVGLPPLWVMLAVVIGGGLFGLPGLLLGIPAMSVLYQLGGEWVHARVAEQEKPT